MASLLRRAFSAVAVAAILAAPALAAAQQVTAPTGATLPNDLPVLVKWTPTSRWASPTVSIDLWRVSPSPLSFGTLATNIPNNGQASVNLPYFPACNPTDTYRINVWSKMDSTTWMTADSANFALSCAAGSLTVIKTLINDSGAPLAAYTFQVDVACGANGPNTTVALSKPGNWQGSVMNIPRGRLCTITEQAPSAPVGCHWATTYPQGKTVTVQAAGRVNSQLEVSNRLSCLNTGPLTAATTLGAATRVPDDQPPTGRLSVRKMVVNTLGVTTPSAFSITAHCTPSGPLNAQLSVPSGQGVSLAAPIIAGSICSVTEAQLASVSPVRACKSGSASWVPTYSSPVTIAAGAIAILSVTNTLTCDVK